MEFTPKKQPLSAVSTSAVRHNPYASGGANFIRKFKHRNSLSPRTTLVITPPRTNIQRRYVSRADRILASSKKHSVPEKSVCVKTPNKQKNVPQATKRPFRAINGQDSKDPYNVCTESEDETASSPRKETKSLVENDKENLCCSSEDEIFLSSSYKKEHKKQVMSFEKENSLFSPPKSKTVRVYSNKKKPIFIGRSRLVSDISPEKIEKAYGTKSILIDEKENVPTKSVADSSTSQVLVPHLIGFPNYGNTCYLNSVLQSLLGLPTFLCDYRQIASELGLNHTSLFYGLSQVLYNRMKGQASGVKLSLRTVKENLERIDGSFTGFKMQDANEFLTKVLDTIKDEIDRSHASQPDSTESQSLNCNANEDLDEDIFLCGATRKSTSEPFSFSVETEVNFSNGVTDNEIVNCASSFDAPGKQRAGVTMVDRALENNKCKQSASVSKRICDSKTSESQKKSVEVKKETQNISRNPVNNNFGFQLLESYRCLGCGEVEGRKQEYFGLYVNLPDDDEHNIQDAISTYMSADERELKCEKCGHDTSSVVTSVTSLPRILIIQLKRYEYKPEQCESIKMSSKVHVNRWISLDNFMTDDVAGPSQWNPESRSVQTSQNPKEATLTIRNLSSELNMCDPKVEEEEEEELPSLSPAKPPVTDGVSSSVPDNEDEELQMVMRRSMDDVQGGQEEDEIQQAIRLSLQEMGMSYSQENQGENSDEQSDEKEEAISVEENKESGRHAYCLISIISHFGLTTNTGHYVSDVYNCDEDSWFHYDDESVARISESVVFAEGRQKNGYIFFYMHKDLFQKIKNKDKR